MRNYHYITLALASSAALADQSLEEIIVTSSLTDTRVDDVSTPLHIINEQTIIRDASQSLGEIVGGLVGVSSSDYGSAVGQPVIRGLGGSRVKVLNNGTMIRDISSLGPDHVNEIDLGHLQQVEIIRGPSSLLYANGAIGGVINIVDNTISQRNIKETQIELSAEYQSVNAGTTGQFSYIGSHHGLNVAASYSDINLGFYDVPSGALIDGPHEEDGLEDDDEHALVDYLNNSDFGKRATKVGISKTGGWGYFGLSIASSETTYGVPFHQEPFGEEGLLTEEDHHDPRIFSDTDSNIFAVQGHHNLNISLINSIDYHFRATKYSLTEMEADTRHKPTLFLNDAEEFGLKLDLSDGNATQKIVVNISREYFEILGEEDFLPATRSEESTFGYFFGSNFSSTHLDVGVRYDQIDRASWLDSFSDNTLSYSAALSREIFDSLEVNFNLSGVIRTPSAMELFINGPHVATQRFERGNVNLRSEQSNNIDLSFVLVGGGVESTFTLFKNKVDDFIYLLDDQDADFSNGLLNATYRQRDAEFFGYELEVTKVVELERGQLSISLGRDQVSSKFRNGEYLPRAVPARNLLGIAYNAPGGYTASLVLKGVAAQDKLNRGETSTAGYQMLDLRMSKEFSLGKAQQLTISLFGKNLLNEVARNHSSFVKDEVPLAGRNIGLKVNLSL